MDIHQLDIDSIKFLADALEEVLNSRMHKREYLGEEIIVKGSLSKALKIPALRRSLSKQNIETRQKAMDQFLIIWNSLSEKTRNAALEMAGLYQPEKLSWDDPRSNRRPVRPG